MVVLLPLYIQKYIIKILCRYIDKNNKSIDYVGGDYRGNESQIKRLMLTLALVSQDWFKTLSNNLTVSVDFNYTNLNHNKNNNNNNNNKNDIDLKYSIIKKENLKTLKLHFDHQGSFFYIKDISIYEKDKKQSPKDNDIFDDDKSDEKIIELDIVNKELEKLSKLKTTIPSTLSLLENQKQQQQQQTIIFKNLILRNISSSNETEDTDILQSLYRCEATDGNIHLLELDLNPIFTFKSLNKIKKHVKKVFTLKINSCFDNELIIESFKQYKNSIAQLFIIKYTSQQDKMQLFPILAGIIPFNNNNNEENKKYNEKINYLENIEFLKIFSMEVSLKDLELILNYSKKVSQLNPSNSMEVNEEFNKIGLLKEALKNNKTLKSLEFFHECYASQILLCKQSPSKTFIERFSSLISSSTSMESFGTGINCPQLIERILEQNKTITDFSVSIVEVNGRPDMIQPYQSLIDKNKQHLNSLKLVKFVFNYETENFNPVILLDYKK
ncbi:hypothetical protein DDB_G0273011 [Dictyostelium discoideum AX4]|uniref:Uncharacterized protein n=1 Tax=Dictyostelium discoideum TaxID=44689 RepID=Q558V8_DICDI|nr:hypothetical protein DDB_G0273011 [Dictyostelium discoideum AX4]EAL71143.1 hypothetical protein DDB_G0273011 [Dictyostelium discoideum AX4]|eukprot:XP_644958.1 hypothetical protein DDB_G0273011 [Dictyostelium discoideum AX4]